MASTGLSSWGNGFVWVNEFRGILERFSGYVPRGLSVYGCIVLFSSALWAGFRCFLGHKVSIKKNVLIGGTVLYTTYIRKNLLKIS